jgi:hypothetical protein
MEENSPEAACQRGNILGILRLALIPGVRDSRGAQDHRGSTFAKPGYAAYRFHRQRRLVFGQPSSRFMRACPNSLLIRSQNSSIVQQL